MNESSRNLDTLVLLADRVIVMCTLFYQYNSYIIIIISTLHYDNQFRFEVGGRCMDTDVKTRREGRKTFRHGWIASGLEIRHVWCMHAC